MSVLVDDVDRPLTATRPTAASQPGHRAGDSLIVVAALATFGSGVLNLYSLMRPALSGRLAWLYATFPIEFISLSRGVVLIAGFALIISSLNIYKRKRRAVYTVAMVAVLSALFHLTKGVDYEEATLSMILAALLWASRRHFTVRSGPLGIGAALTRLVVTVLAGAMYGVLGFWLLDPREFGIDFSWREALQQTLLYLAFASDPRLVAQTRHALWFLDSLSLTTAIMVVYSLAVVFRPVRYRLLTRPQERIAAQAIVHAHGRSSLDFFKPWPDKSYFFTAGSRAFLAYRAAGGFALVLADPVGPETDIEPIVVEFARFCAENDWGVAFYQTLPDFLPVYARCGFAKLKLGDEAIVDLRTFTLDTRARKGLRLAVHKVERQGLDVHFYEPPLTDEIVAQLQAVSDDWRRIPGRRERQFTLGRFSADYVRQCPVLVASTSDGVMQAFVNVIPSYHKGETTIDLMRRRSAAPNGVMDFLLVKLFSQSRERGFERFSLGLAPMAGFQEKEDASPEERAIHAFFQRLTFVFSFGGLRAYKAKFATDWEPRYLVYRNALDLPRVALTLARVSEIRREPS